MDDILAIVLFFVACSITGLFIRSMLKSHKLKVELAEIERKEAEARASASRAHSLASAIANAPPRKKRTFVKREDSTVPPRGKETTVTYAPSPTQSVQSSNILSDIADVAMIANTIHHWNDNSRSEPVREERSVGVSKSESSWGFDDSDSRKSISSSMDTSSSYSSSSSDSSSSWSSSDSSSSVSSDW